MSDPIPLPVGNKKNIQRSDAAANRARILQAARPLFAENDPAIVSMSDVVDAAGIGRGTLYRHFPTKGDLCLALIDEEMRDFQDDVLVLMSNLVSEEVPPLAQLAAFLDTAVAFTERHTPLLYETNLTEKVAPYEWQRILVMGLLQTAVAQKHIASELNISYLTDALLSLVNARFHYFQRTERNLTPEQIQYNLRAILTQLQI